MTLFDHSGDLDVDIEQPVTLADLQEASSVPQDLGLLLLRLVGGGLLSGHGSQKLFGLFGGHGLQGTAGWLESIGLKPGLPWAIAAGSGELGGSLMALGR